MVRRDEKKITAGEAVGIIAAQSLGEPGTQMSTAFDEVVLVNEKNRIKLVEIGPYIDTLIQKYGAIKIDESEICDLPSDVKIIVPSLDGNGKIEWKRLNSVSRHRCKRPLLEIVLRSGRKIRTTKNHSFVIRKTNRIIPINGSDLKLGDRLPVIRNLPVSDCSNFIALEDYLPKSEFIYGSEITKARDNVNPGLIMNFPMPFAQNSFPSYLQNPTIEEGFVYPYPLRTISKGVPEVLRLDSLLGWLIGAYLSEGYINNNAIGLSNVDECSLQNARRFAKRYCLNCREKTYKGQFGPSHTLFITRKEFAKLIEKTCGKGSFNKHVPEFAFSAGEEFIGALLRGYFDGDGNVNVKRGMIRVHSKSKSLLDGISLLLNRLGIFARKRVEKRRHVLIIQARYAKIFREKIGSDIAPKAKALDDLCKLKATKTHYDLVEMIVGFGSLLKDISRKLGLYKKGDAFSAGIRKFTRKQKIGRETLRKYINLFSSVSAKKRIDINSELAILKSYLDEDIVWDEIVEIKQFIPENKMVYDFSVDGLETFATAEGVITHNTLRTFHYAGVAEAVPVGLPRMIEIVDAKKEPKRAFVDIHVQPKYAHDERKVAEIARKIEQVLLGEVAQLSENFQKKQIMMRLDKDAIAAKGLEMAEVKKAIKAAIGEGLVMKSQRERILIKGGRLSLRQLRKLTVRLRALHLRGVNGITKAMVMKGEKGYFIRAGGSNIAEVVQLPEVDPSQCYTNNIMQIYDLLGVEAARNAIVRELKLIMELQDLALDIHHIRLLADAMTSNGEITSIGRHGLSGQKQSVLARAAFEETVKHLISAAVRGEEDALKGVTENILIGQPIPLGSGRVRLRMKQR